MLDINETVSDFKHFGKHIVLLCFNQMWLILVTLCKFLKIISALVGLILQSHLFLDLKGEKHAVHLDCWGAMLDKHKLLRTKSTSV